MPYLEDQYADMVLPRMSAGRRSIVDWGVRYVGYPYIWAGEWGFDSPSPSAFGGQPGPGFDCSGLSWWALRADDNVYWEISPPRPYGGLAAPSADVGGDGEDDATSSSITPTCCPAT